MSAYRMTRRDLLKTTGLSGAFLPLLSSGQARGAGVFPKRMVIIAWSNGVRRNDFWPELGPTRSATDWILPVPGTAPPRVPKAVLPILEPLVKDFRNDMLILGGLDLLSMFQVTKKTTWVNTPSPGAGHDSQIPLTTGDTYGTYYGQGHGTALGPSIDQFIGKAIAQKVAVPFPTLVLGGQGTNGGYQGSISFAGKESEGITPETDPAKLFNTLFAGRNLGADVIARNLARRKSQLDFVSRELERFGQNMGTDDRRKLQAHLDSIRGLERGLSSGSVSCTTPATPVGDFRASGRYPEQLRAQLDLLAVALKCDLTRVSTVLFENTGGNNIVFSWLGQEFTGTGDEYPTRQHHDIAHNFFRNGDLGARRHSRVNQWFFEQVAYFAGLLKNTPEGDGTMLDNTAIVVLNTMGQNHAAVGIPCVIIGGCGGAIKTGGRLLRFGEWATQTKHPYYWGSGELGMLDGVQVEGGSWTVKGVAHNQLLTTLAHAMDAPVDTFGSPNYSGTLPGVLA